VNDTLVSCAVGNVEYALRAGDIIAVMRAERMRAPAACEGGIGVVTVGGQRASVYPLGATAGLPVVADDSGGPRDRHIVVLRSETGPVGWLVDHVSRSRLPERAHVLPLPPLVGARAQRWFDGVLSAGDRAMLLLSLSPATHGDGSPFAEGAPTRAHRTSMPMSTSTADGPLVVTFGTDALPQCGASRYAVSARRVAGVESGLEVVAVPGSESPVIGVSVWRGEVLPVIDFRTAAAFLGAERQRLLIVRCGGPFAGTSVAIPIDAETTLCQPTRDNALVDPVHAGAGTIPGYVAGLFDFRGQMVALIDPDALLCGQDAVSATAKQAGC